MRILLFISVFLSAFCALAQNENVELHFLEGALYGGLPVEISFQSGEKINGYSKYGSTGKVEYTVEGERMDDGYILYEFDENHSLSGILEMNADRTKCIWNSVDYRTTIPLDFDKKTKTTTYDYVSHQSYIVANFPSIDDNFDGQISKKVNKVVRDLAESYGVKEIENGVNSPRNRFTHRTIAINKIDLHSKDLISGYLTFYDNQSSDVATLTYTYDINKKEMLGLHKIFKKNFNYSFFLKQYISQKKEKLETLMSPLESKWVNHSSFHHYVLTDTGLKFFNDYNTIFGRKSFTIPYHEVSSSIGQKSISNYIKKRK